MKNKSIYLWILLLAALIVTYVPKLIGEKMSLPNEAEIEIIEMENIIDRKSQSKKTVEDKKLINEIMNSLSNNKKTVKSTSNDAPLEPNYLNITLKYRDKFIRIYLYEAYNKYYFEIPYTGIYKTNKSTMDTLYTIYNNIN